MTTGSPEPRRLAIVCRWVSGVTGTTTTILEHGRRLRSLGWEVHVFGERLDAGRLAAAGTEPHVVRAWRLGPSYLRRRLFDWSFRREIRTEGFDLVWGHGDTLDQDLLSLHNCVHAANEAVHGKPLPASSGVGRLHAKILRERRFKVVIANSRLMADELRDRFGLPAESVRAIYPGHDPVRFKPGDRALGAELRAGLGAGPEDPVVGLITSGDFEKRGVAPFLRSLALLPPDVRGRLRVLVAGRETRLGAYHRLAAESGLGERIRFLPPRPDVERLYHALDVYVHPALYEEFGQSVQEALACGVPVLTTARVGAAELLPLEARSSLLEGPDPAGLARRLEALLRDAPARRRLGALGPEACRANTWDANFKATLEVLEECRARSSSR